MTVVTGVHVAHGCCKLALLFEDQGNLGISELDDTNHSARSKRIVYHDKYHFLFSLAKTNKNIGKDFDGPFSIYLQLVDSGRTSKGNNIAPS